MDSVVIDASAKDVIRTAVSGLRRRSACEECYLRCFVRPKLLSHSGAVVVAGVVAVAPEQVVAQDAVAWAE